MIAQRAHRWLGATLLILMSLALIFSPHLQRLLPPLTAHAALVEREELTLTLAPTTLTPRAPRPSPTATPRPTVTPRVESPTATPEGTTQPHTGDWYRYFTQAGDTLPALAYRFGVPVESIRPVTPETVWPLPGLLPPDLPILIPRLVRGDTPADQLLPDSEVIASPSSLDFDPEAYAREAGGYLARYVTFLPTPGELTGPQTVAFIARHYSINPRLLLALLEYQSGWVRGEPRSATLAEYPMGRVDPRRPRLAPQLAWAAEQLSVGYYGWREGWIRELTFADGTRWRLDPTLNAGTVALMYFFAQVLSPDAWRAALDPANPASFPVLYQDMFGDPWLRARWAEPLYPPDLSQPPMILPFERNVPWALTSGPHGAYGREGARAALDFAPPHKRGEPCQVSREWILAVADGVVARVEPGELVLDLDGDGREQTGWNVLYLHISQHELQVREGDRVRQGDRLGHASCEGGRATGSHIHLARKYNGEWIAAGGPIPFNLGGWIAENGPEPYQGRLVRGDEVVEASPIAAPGSHIQRGDDDP
ncbi:MAG: M23 family metallopeptidase [Chloroflexi bacterium]|nr:M23 family metallopeptidase [Chloroflexota bacterium]